VVVVAVVGAWAEKCLEGTISLGYVIRGSNNGVGEALAVCSGPGPPRGCTAVCSTAQEGGATRAVQEQRQQKGAVWGQGWPGRVGCGVWGVCGVVARLKCFVDACCHVVPVLGHRCLCC
jgi:hypothetical protein